LFLKKYPSLINKGDDQKVTPLHYASLNGDVDIVEFLVSKGATNCVDVNGETPLHLASLNGHLSVVKYLIEIGSDFNVQSSNGSTPLHLACTNQQLKVIGYLLSIPNLKRDVRDNMGNTPAIIASNTKNKVLMEYFEDEKRELYLKLEALEDRVGVLDEINNQAIIRYENDQKSITRAYNQIDEIERELDKMKNEMKMDNESRIKFITNNDTVNSLKQQIIDINEKNSTTR